MKILHFFLFLVLIIMSACEIMPRNTLNDCQEQCKDSKKSKACYAFCDCIHKKGQALDTCLEEYDSTKEE